MEELMLFAIPWWVNLLFLVPFVSWYFWKRVGGLEISGSTLAQVGLFGAAFGLVEASVVVYLRAALGLLPGFEGALSDVQVASMSVYEQAQLLEALPSSLLTVEIVREAATMIMLVTIALIAIKRWPERWAIFLWTFAAWDIMYYVGLWAMVRWPESLLTPDVLFLIPVPWFSQVWYPLLVSLLTMIAVVLARKQFLYTHFKKSII